MNSHPHSNSICAMGEPLPNSVGGVWMRYLIRPRRVLLLLAAIWVLNIFDLAFTMMESRRHTFVELNPFAARLIDGPSEFLVAYKALLVVISSTILLKLCRHSLTEFGCWLMFFTYLGVALAWQSYYEHLPIALDDPALVAGAAMIR